MYVSIASEPNIPAGLERGPANTSRSAESEPLQVQLPDQDRYPGDQSFCRNSLSQLAPPLLKLQSRWPR